MASLIRACKPLTRSIPRTLHSRTSTTVLLQSHHFQPQQQCRNASKKAHKATQPTSSSTFVPGSQVVSLDPAAVSLHGATDAKMQAAVDWYRKEVAGYETRAAGRVTPALLAPVRVVLPGKGGESVKLEEVATVGVREGTTLLVTVFEEANLKHVETAIYSAKLPNITPQKFDSRTIKIPIPRPTVESRLALYSSAQKQAEEVRVQIRKHHQASVKKGAFKKFSIEIEGFQKLMEKHIAEVDSVLAAMKKTSGAK